MSKQNLLMTALGLGLIILVGGWFLIARSFLGGNTAELQNTIIQPENQIIEARENNEDTAQIEPQEIQPGSQEPDNISINELQGVGTLRLAIPPFVDVQAIKQLTTIINTTKDMNITLQISQPQTLHAYKQLLAEEYTTYDIALVPSIRSDSLIQESLTLPFEKNIHTVFHPSLRELIQEHSNWIPFSLDPLLTISSGELSYDETLSWIDIEKELIHTTQDIGFGFSKRDKIFLENMRHPLPGYMRTLEQILASHLSSGTFNFLFQLFDTPFWDTKEILEHTTSSTNTTCKQDAQVCLLAQQDIAIGFASMSDIISTSIDQNNFSLYPLPDQEGLTAHAWGFMVPTKNTNRDTTLSWLVGYLQEAATSNTGLRDTTLPAFNTTLQQHLLQTNMKHIKKYIKNNALHLTSGTLDNLTRWSDTTPLADVIQGDYSVKLYIEKFGK